MHRVLAALLAAASCASVALAQTAPPVVAEGTLNLGQALSEAGAISPSIEESGFGVRSAEAGRVVAGLRPNPTVTTEVENVVGTGAYRGLEGADTTVTFAVPLELGGKRSARIAVADAEISQSRLRTQVAYADLRLAVTRAYINVIATERRLAIAESQIEITTENLRVARDRVMVGANSPIDEQRANLQHVDAQTELAQARVAAAEARRVLERFLGRPLVERLDTAWFDQVEQYGPDAPISAEGTLAHALAQANMATADARVRLARSQRIPDLTLSAGTRRLSGTNDQAMVFSVSVPLPVFNSGRAGVDQAIAQRSQADAQRRTVLFDAEQSISAVRAERDRAAAAVRASVPALEAALEAARIARIGYGEGKFDQMVLLDAERTLLERRRQAIDALVAYHDAEARLARLTAPATVPAATGN
jgi:cobalt-zinc-cadmium efflux system outer membrane protein